MLPFPRHRCHLWEVTTTAESFFNPIDPLDLDLPSLVAEFRERLGKGEYHALALFRQIQRTGASDPASLPEYARNPTLAKEVAAQFPVRLPPVCGRSGDGSTFKFLLRLRDGLESESVVIPMRSYKSLCVSSQVGCKMGCAFCETARLGHLRNLEAGEIVAQVLVARHVLGEPVENVVFMGMGEPMDNLDNVLRAVRILSDRRGLGISLPSITISTVGHVDGIRRLAALATLPPPEGLPRMRLAVSLNAPNDALRSELMPVNRRWNLAQLREALVEYPLTRPDDVLFLEYVLLEGVNDSRKEVLEIVELLRGLRACVNLIPFNPGPDSPYQRPPEARVKEFHRWLLEAGQYSRIRGPKGVGVMAACGQLGNPELKRPRGD
ncbi:MAG: dual-specificity methyltransferase RlmN [Fibrobacterota bacterium]|jgi:23S rRNA (adenine2503-C2)-methyltransferase